MLSLTVLPETCFKIKITLSLHCSESPSGQEKRLSPQQEITVKLKDKNMTSWPSAFFLHSHLPLFNLHTSVTFTFPPSLLFFFFASCHSCLPLAASFGFIVVRPHCSFTLSWSSLSHFRSFIAGSELCSAAGMCEITEGRSPRLKPVTVV